MKSDVFTLSGYGANGELGEGSKSNSYRGRISEVSNYQLQPSQTVINLKKGQTVDFSVSPILEISLVEKPFTINYTTRSLDESVATASGNSVTGVETGTTYIKLEDNTNGIYGSIQVNVNEADGTTYPKIAAGHQHFIALKSDGKVYTWGYNNYGQLGSGKTSNRAKPEIAYAYVLNADGTIAKNADGTNKVEEIKDAIDVAAGWEFSLVLRKDGTMWAAGYNGYGQLGSGNTESQSYFKKVKLNGTGTFLTGIKQISAGYNTSYALTNNGKVYAWGYGGYGQLGTGDSPGASYYPRRMIVAKNIMQIASGSEHSVTMLKADGTAWSAGNSNYGQLGIADTADQNVPRYVMGKTGNGPLKNIKEVSAGYYTSTYLLENGTVWSSGYNGEGQLGNGNTNSTYGGRVTQVATKAPVAATETTAAVPGEYLEGVKHIASNGYSTYAFMPGNQGMYVWGRNNYGQLFTNGTGNKRVATKVENGTEILLGTATKQTDSPTGIFVDRLGRIYTVGYNGNGQIGNETTENRTEKWCITKSKINAIQNTSSNPLHNNNIVNFEEAEETFQLQYAREMGFNLLTNTFLRRNIEFTSLDEKVATVDASGRVTSKGYGTTLVRIEDKTNQISMAVRINVNGRGNQTQAKIVGGGKHFVALRGNGDVYTWGLNNYGQLGIGNTSNQYQAKQTNMKNAIDVAAGTEFTLVLRKDGTVWSTGLNNYGQLGSGDTRNETSFHKVRLNANTFLSDVVQIAAGEVTAYALTKNGEVYTWGYDGYGQAGRQGTTSSRTYPVRMKKVNNIVQIAGGYNHFISMLDASGSVWFCGNFNEGQGGTGRTGDYYNLPQKMLAENGQSGYIQNVKEVATSYGTTYILKEDGNVWGTGRNSEGQLGQGNGSNTSRFVQVMEKKGTESEPPVYIHNIKHIYASGFQAIFTRQKTADGKNQGMYVVGRNNYKHLFTEKNNGGNITVARAVQTNSDVIAVGLTRNYDEPAGAFADQDGMVYTVGRNDVGQVADETREDKYEKVCISKKKIEPQDKVINFEEAEERAKINYSTKLVFNLIRDNIPGDRCTFQSMDENVATVDQNGNVTAKGIGYTFIRLSNPANNLYEGVLIKVNGKDNIAQPKIVGGGRHFVALKGKGQVWAWGQNNYGQLGIGNNTDQTKQKQAYAAVYDENGNVKKDENGNVIKETIEDAIDVAAGVDFTLVLRKDGSVWSTGLNNYGQLGDGTTNNRNIFYKVKKKANEYLDGAVQLTAGEVTSYALMETGEVYTWGYDGYGQSGVQGTTSSRTYPVRMRKVNNIIQIAGGFNHFIVMLDADGTVWFCGYFSEGQSGTERTGDYYYLPQKMLAEKGQSGYVQNVKEVAAGYATAYILKENGSVWGTGRNSEGQIGQGNGNNTSRLVRVMEKAPVAATETTEAKPAKYIEDIKHIYASGFQAAFTRQKTQEGGYQGMYTVGRNNYGQLFTESTGTKNVATKVETDKDILVAAFTRNYDTPSGAFADQDGKVYTIGFNEQGQLANETKENNIRKWSVSNLKLVATPKVINYKNPGDTGERITQEIQMDFNILNDKMQGKKYTYHSMDEKVATVDENGVVTATGVGSTYVKVYNEENDLWAATRVNVNGDQGYVSPKIVGGGRHFVALKADGKVKTWGDNNYGQLGNGNNSVKREPDVAYAAVYDENGNVKKDKDGKVIKEEIEDAIDVAAGTDFTLVLRKDGSVWATGLNNYRQLGDGTTDNRNVFYKVKKNSKEYLTGAVQLTAGEVTSYALMETGEVYTWGYDGYGQSGIQSTSGSRTYPVRMLKVDNIIQIAGGYNHFIVMLDASGTVWFCGYFSEGQGGTGRTGDYYNLPQKMLAESGKSGYIQNVKEVAAGYATTYILKEDGSVWGTGRNSEGQLGQGHGNTASRFVQVMKKAPVAATETTEAKPAEYIEDIKHIYASGFQAIFTRQKTEDGENQGMYVVGRNNYGQLFTGNAKSQNVAKAVETDKDIIAVGLTKDYDNPAGAFADQDGMVYTAGYNAQAQIGNGTVENTATKVCISKLKMKAEPSVIDYQNPGDTGKQITYSVSSGFNLLYNDLDQGTCTFESLDEDIATVDNNGVVTAEGLGVTHIKLTNIENGCYAAVRVQVSGNQGKTYPKIAGGNNLFIALKANGEVWTWGYNSNGQLGLGNTARKGKPTKTNIYDAKTASEEEPYAVDVAAGQGHSLVLMSDGTVRAAGLNNYGQLGNGNTSNSSTFKPVVINSKGDLLRDVVQITAGEVTSYALTKDGHVYTWGYDGYGQSGVQSTSSSRTYPVRMQKVDNIIQIAAGYNHYVVLLDADGSVWFCGNYSEGQAGNGRTGDYYNLPQKMRNETNDGTLYGIKKVAAGYAHTVLLKTDGTMLAVGRNSEGQLGINSTSNISIVKPVLTQGPKDEAGKTTYVPVENIKDISADGFITMAIRKPDAEGKAGIYVTGRNNYGQLYTKNTTNRKYMVPVESDRKIITTAATKNYDNQTAAIADDLGQVYTVGYNANGEMGDETTVSTVNPTNISDATFDVNSQRMTLKLVTNPTGKIEAATDLGFNLLYNIVENEVITYKSLDENIATVDANGNVTAKYYGSTKIEVTTNKLSAKAIVKVDVLRAGDVAKPKLAAGKDHQVALKADGTVWTWGLNSSGQLGTKDTNNRYKPTKISVPPIIDIAAGENYTLLLGEDGKVYSFGYNGYGQLGRSGSSSTPTEIPGLKDIVEIAAGTYHSMALTKNGEVYVWGYNGNGQLGLNNYTNYTTPQKLRLKRVIEISCKNQTSSAVDSDGNLWTWGYNGYGQLGTGNNNSSTIPTKIVTESAIVDVKVENDTIVALGADGYVYTSGYNGNGNLGNGNTTGRSTFGKVMTGVEEVVLENGETKQNPIYLTDVTQIDATFQMAVAKKKDGSIYTFGINNYGQAGTGDKAKKTFATKVQYGKDKEAVTDVFEFALADGNITFALNDGTVWSIGKNNYGQVGDKSTRNRTEFVCISKNKISFEESPIRIKGIGRNANIRAQMVAGFNLLYNEVADKNLTYTIRNPEIATVNETTGVLTSVRKGKTTATVTDTISGQKASIDVYVLGDEDITFPQIETYNYATVTLKANGEVWSYGQNDNGRLGTGDNRTRTLPTYTGINNIVQISLGENHALAVDTEGHVWAWGYNGYGQLGNGKTGESWSKVQVLAPEGSSQEYLSNIIAVATGDNFSMALDKDGNVYGWGYNGYYQYGTGNSGSRSKPVKIEELENIRTIRAAGISGYAIDADNNLWVAGYNGYGNLGDSTTQTRTKFVQNVNLEEVADVRPNKNYTCYALLLDGSVWGFGNNADNALTGVGGTIPMQLNGPEGPMENITEIAAGYNTGYAITAEGKALSWGLNNYYQRANGTNTTDGTPTYIQDKDGNVVEDVMLISGGTYYTELAKTDGTVWSIGYNGYGQLGDSTTQSARNLVCISSEYIQLAEREVTLKLSNPNYQIAPETIYGFNLLYEKSVNLGFTYTSLDEDIATVDAQTGMVTAKGLGKTYIHIQTADGEHQTRLCIHVIGEAKLTREKVQAGHIHSLALKQDGTIWAWGNNTEGEMGNGTRNHVRTLEPTRIETGKYKEVKQETTETGEIATTTTIVEKELNDMVDIAAGYHYNLAVDSEGYIWAWGYNGYGQLGNGNTEGTGTPTRIEGIDKVKSVSIHHNTSRAITENGEVYVWGNGFSYLPTKQNVYTKAVQLAGDCALLEDGTVWRLDQTPVKMGTLRNIVQIASKDGSYAALCADGKVYVWGYNGYGQLSQGNTDNISKPVYAKTMQDDEKVDLENIVEISAGNNAFFFVNREGQMYVAGYNSYGTLSTGKFETYQTIAVPAINASQVKTMKANSYHTVVSDTNGFVYTTGYNAYGELGDGTYVNRNTLAVIGDTYVHVSDKVVNIEVGDFKKVTATLDNKFNLIQDVVDSSNILYDSRNTDIATVSREGKITAKKMGKAEIIARHTITNKTAIIFVNVVPEGKIAVPEVRIGRENTAVLKADGTVWTYGQNTYGELGIGNNSGKVIPTQVKLLEDVMDISSGEYHVSCVKQDGTVWSFGNNGSGRLGGGTGTNRNKPVQVHKTDGTILKNIVKVAAGRNKTVALDNDGGVWVWGYGYEVAATKIATPDSIIDISENYLVTQGGKVLRLSNLSELSLRDIIRVTEGVNHTMFLDREGYGYALGTNNKGQLGNGTIENSNRAMKILAPDGENALEEIEELSAGNEFSMARTKDGSVYVWGSNANHKLTGMQVTDQVIPKKLAGITGSIGISAGYENGAYIDHDGFVYAWGLGKYGNLGNKKFETISEPAMVGREDVGLNSYNIIVKEGEEFELEAANHTFNVLRDIKDESQMRFTSSKSAVATVSADGIVRGIKAGYTSIIVRKEGSDYVSVAQVNVIPSASEKVAPMALTCGSHTVVLKANGTVWSYGVGSNYELGDGTNTSKDVPVQVKFPEGIVIQQIAVGNTHNLALDTDGNVWGWGSNSNYALAGWGRATPEKIGLSGIKKIAANNDQSLAITEDGFVYVWGANKNGELGTKTYETITTPTLIPYVNNIMDASLGKNHTILLNTNGKILTTGLNSYGQTGKEEGKSNTFEEIPAPEFVTRISAGDNHTIFLTNKGEIYTFGYNINGQLGSGNTKNIATPTRVSGIKGMMNVSAGKNHTIVLAQDRTIYASGLNNCGELGIGTREAKVKFTQIESIGDFITISGGNTYNVAIRYDGDVYGWGDYYHGLQSVKTKTNSRIPMKIGNDASYANEPEITIPVNGTKQAEITPRYTFNVFRENEEYKDYTFECLNTQIATVNEKGLITGKTVGTTWVKATESTSGKVNVILVRVIGEGQKYAPMVAGGDRYAAVLKADGSVWGFGYNSDGQLGNDKLVPINIPSQANILATYKKVVTGQSFTMALRDDGTVWAWGDNTYGVLGQGNRVSAKKPIQVQELRDIVDIACGDNHAIALDTFGNIYTWGLNSKGQLGNGDTITRTKPETINGIGNQVISIAAAGNMTAIVDAKENVYVFGDNSNEQIAKFVYNKDQYGQNILPEINPYYMTPQKVHGTGEIVKVECQKDSIIILKVDGSVHKISKYAIEDDFVMTQIADGNMVDISANSGNVMLQDVEGSIYTYGANEYGQAGNGTTNTTIDLYKITDYEDKPYFTIGTGYKNNYAIDTEGFVFAVGDNAYGQIGDGTYEDKYQFTIVGDREFKIVPDARTMKQGEEETVKIEANIFNVFNRNQRNLKDYEWTSSNPDFIPVTDGVILGKDMGEATITAVDKLTGARTTALRVVQPTDEQRIAEIQVNDKIAKLVGENKYAVTAVANEQGKATLIVHTNDKTDQISINAGANYQGNGYFAQDIALDSDPKVVKIRVLASTGRYVDYTLTIDVVSNNANLKSLTVNGIAATAVGDKAYEVILSNSVTKPVVVAQTEDVNAKVSIDSAKAEKHQASRTIDGFVTKNKKVVPVVVTTESGTEVEYTLTIYNEDALTSLDTIVVNNVEAEKISKDTYKVIIPEAEVGNIEATAVYEKAKVKIDGYDPEVHISQRPVATLYDQTIVKIYVTEGETEREYTLIIDKEGTENHLGLFSVSINGKVIEPQGNIYDAYIAGGNNLVSLVAETISETDLITINDSETRLPEVHMLSVENLPANEDVTTYTIYVIDPENENNKKEYTLNIKKPSSDVTLSSVTVGNEEFSKEAKLVTGTKIYEVSIPDEYNEIDVLAKTHYELASVSVADEEYEQHISKRTVDVTGKEMMEVSIWVKSQNGALEEYTLRIYRESGNTNLAKVTVDGELATLSETESDTYVYTLDRFTDKVTLGAMTEDVNAQVSINRQTARTHVTYEPDVPMNGKSIVSYIVVTSEAGTTKEYKLIVYAIPDNIRLDLVKVNDTKADVLPDNEYEAKINRNDRKFNLYISAEDEKATIQVQGREAQGSISLSDLPKQTDEVEIPVTVIAQDGTTASYIIRVKNQSSNANLAMVRMGEEVIQPNAVDGKYYIDLKYLTESIDLEAIAEDENATVSINGTTPEKARQLSNITVPNVENVIHITVVAEDGTEGKYEVLAKKLSNNTKADIFYRETSDAREEKVIFNSDRKATIRVGNLDEVYLKAIAENPKTTITIGEYLPMLAQTEDLTIITTEERTTVNIGLQAEDGTKEIFEITFVRNAKDNELESLTAKDIQADDIRSMGDGEYEIRMPDTMDRLELTAVAKDKAATVQIDGGEFSSTNTKVQVVEVPDKTKEISIIVRAENGDEKVYRVTIIKQTDLGLRKVVANEEDAYLEEGVYKAFLNADANTATLQITPNKPEVLLSMKEEGQDWTEEVSSTTHTFSIDTSESKDKTILVRVKDPQDTTRIATYTVILAEKSHEASLELVRVDGKDAMLVDNKYSVGTNMKLVDTKVYAKASNKYADILIETLGSGKGEVNLDAHLPEDKIITYRITVTAQDGIAKAEYILEIERKSADTGLQVLVNQVSPEEYDDETKTFTKYIDRGLTKVKLELRGNNSEATITYAGQSQKESLTVEEVAVTGETTILEVNVMAENGDQETYFVNLVKNSVDQSIGKVLVNEKEIQEVDGKYQAIVYEQAIKPDTAEIEVIANNKKAKVQIGEGTAWSEGSAKTTVSFVDGVRMITLALAIDPQDPNTETNTKTLEIRLVSDDNSIKSVKNGDATIRRYDAETHTYIEYVRKDVTEVTLAIEANSPYATLTANGVENTGSIAIGNIDVAGQEEVVQEFRITSESGRSQTYFVKIYKMSDNANAKHIYVDGNDIMDLFENADNVPTYIYSIEKLKSWTRIKVETENEFATVRIGDTEPGEGDCTRDISLDLDKNSITVPILITSQDGTVTKTYNIIFVRISNNTKIQWLEVNEQHIIENANGDYEVFLKASEDVANVKIVLEDVLARVNLGGREKKGSIEEQIILPETGTAVRTITITAQDGTVVTHKLTIYKQANELELDKVYLDNRIATKTGENTFEIDVVKGQTSAAIRAIAKKDSEYVSIEGAEKTLKEQTIANQDISSKEVKIKVTAMFENKVDQEKEYTLIIKEVDSIEELEDMQVTIKVGGDKVLPNQEGKYVKVIAQDATNTDVWAGITSETSKVKITDQYSSTEYEYPEVEKNISITGDRTEVTVTIRNGNNEEVTKTVILISGGYKLQGKVITQATDQTRQSATITLYRTEDTREEGDELDPREVISQSGINPDGTFEIAVLSGTYDMVITKAGYLEHRLIQIAVDGDVTLEDIAIFAGDVVKTGEIQVDDLIYLKEQLGEAVTVDNVEYDLNEDGSIDEDDQKILKANYKKKAQVVTWVAPARTMAARKMSKLEVKKFVLPLTCEYRISSEYGVRTHPITGEEKKHHGIDLVGEHHTSVVSIADGEVTYSGIQNGYGNCIEVKHTIDGETIYSFYAHLSERKVKVGDKVLQGQEIGLEGGDPKTDDNPGNSTGHHLHFEIRTESGSGHSVDPRQYIEF